MQKVEQFNMPPSICFVCTAAPSEPVCDTLLDFDPGVQTPRNGRIYICASCAQTAADALGLFDASKERVTEAEAKVTEIETRMEAYANIAAAIEVVRPTPVVEEKPAAKKGIQTQKPAASKPEKTEGADA